MQTANSKQTPKVIYFFTNFNNFLDSLFPNSSTVAITQAKKEAVAAKFLYCRTYYPALGPVM
jgi:hypothetical protein